jgi:glycosyltransferase involved in cell wall biosynthesis
LAKVLLVGKGSPDRGGIAAFLASLLSSELAELHDLRFLNVAHADEPQGGRATVANVRRTLSDAAALWREARGVDIVHLHSALNPLVTITRAAAFIVVARARGAQVIVHAHGGKVQLWMKGRGTRLTLRLALKGAARVVAVSSEVHRTLEVALGRSNVLTIENGVDTEAFTPGPREHDPPRLLYVGLLTPRKGVLDLIEASAVLRERGVRHELWLAGGTPDEGAEGAEHVRSRAVDVARLVGERPHEAMPALYAEVDAFCLPSWWEGMPLCVLEAMSAGLPVVATRVGEVPAMLEEGRTGFLVELRDPQGLADALEPILADPALRREAGDAARAHVKSSYSLTRTAATLDRLYRDILAP